jgi:hypothetical protein
MKLIARAGAILMMLFLAGCGATVVRPDELSSVEGSGKQVHVKAFSYYNIGLKEGDYIASFESQEGTYYRGPGRCALIPPAINNNAKKYPDSTRYGGLYISKSNPKVYRVYYYQDTDPNLNRLDATFGTLASERTDNMGMKAASVSGAATFGAAIPTGIQYMMDRDQGQMTLIPATTAIDIGSFVSARQ